MRSTRGRGAFHRRDEKEESELRSDGQAEARPTKGLGIFKRKESAERRRTRASLGWTGQEAYPTGRYMEGIDIQAIVRQAVQEFVNNEQAKTEPAHKAELQEERKRREQLERRLNELVEENKRSRKMAAEAERSSTVRAELQRLGVGKIDLAFRAVQDGIVRTEDGRLVARNEAGETPLKEYLTAFVNENPEFLPARIAGGTGMTATLKAPVAGRETVDLERIRPGMSAEEMQRVREEIVRVASQTLKGL